MALLVAADQGAGAALDYLYLRSTGSPVTRIAMAAPRTLVLGSSAGKYAIDPKAFLPGSYNGAENGQGLFYVAAVLRNLPRNEKFERVVIAFDPADFTTGTRAGNLKHLWRVAPLGRHDPLVREWLALGDPWTELKLRSGLFPYRGEIDSVVEGWWRPRSWGDGYKPLAGSIATLPPKPDDGEPLPVRPEAQRALDAIVAAARRLDVQLIAVVTPTAGRQRAREKRYAGALAAIRAAFAAGGHCDLTDPADPALDAFVLRPDYFWDGPHLNGTGATVYSRILRDTVARRCGG